MEPTLTPPYTPHKVKEDAMNEERLHGKWEFGGLPGKGAIIIHLGTIWQYQCDYTDTSEPGHEFDRDNPHWKPLDCTWQKTSIPAFLPSNIKARYYAEMFRGLETYWTMSTNAKPHTETREHFDTRYAARTRGKKYSDALGLSTKEVNDTLLKRRRRTMQKFGKTETT